MVYCPVDGLFSAQHNGIPYECTHQTFNQEEIAFYAQSNRAF